MVTFDPYLSSRPLAEALNAAPPGATDRGRPVLHVLVGFLLHQPAGAAAERAGEQPGLRLVRAERSERRLPGRPRVSAALVAPSAAAITWQRKGRRCPAWRNWSARRCAAGGERERRQIPVHQSIRNIATSVFNHLNVRAGRGVERPDGIFGIGKGFRGFADSRSRFYFEEHG